MNFDQLFGMVTGEAGVVALLLALVVFLINGKILPKGYVDDLRETNATLREALQKQSESLETIANVTKESLETTKATHKIITAARLATGVQGEEVD